MHKCEGIARLQVGAGGRGPRGATLAEAEVLSDAGLADEQTAVDLARTIAEIAGLEFAGVQGYVGNHENTGDFDPVPQGTNSQETLILPELGARDTGRFSVCATTAWT